MLVNQADLTQTLFVCDTRKLASNLATNTKVIAGDVFNLKQVQQAVQGQDIAKLRMY
ncbi:hypothetical protein F895_02930 [Acinetobacter sp. CIP 64.2]|uniref:hypothetical protein n=1 Tax=Acinetobacter TaxID=469 RepID=UPI000287DD7B|nr:MULTISPECIES: hypothetical protein [Acinetobacter]ENX12554.1 hypothetical protein F895_02930 [Acinetobacter sp. CIP 64.2]UUM26038.1 hypothetical protein NQU59_09805 [Acinetobacter colistiniresistens]